MANEKISVQMDLLANTRSYNAAMAQATKETKEFSNTLKGIRAPAAQVGQSLGNLTKNLVALAGVAVGLDALKDSLVGIIETGAEFERLNNQIVQLTGSVAVGEAAFAWIEDFAKETPLGLDQVTKAFIQLQSAGLDPADGTLQSLTDVTVKYADSLSDLSGVVKGVTDAINKDVLQQEEINQLRERNIPIMKALENVTGQYGATLAKTIKDGEIGAENIRAVVDELGRLSAGAAVAEMDSFNGRLSNLRDAWAQAQNQIAQAGVLEAVSDIIAELSDEIARLSESGAFEEWGRTAAEIIRGIYESAKFVAGVFAEWSGLIRGLAAAWAAAKIFQWGAQILELRREMLKLAATMPLVTGGVRGLGKALAIVGGAIAIDAAVDGFLNAADAAKETEQSAVELARKLIDLQDKMGQFGAAGEAAGEQVVAIWDEFKAGAITAEEAIASATALFKELEDQAKKVVAAEQALNAEQARLAQLQKDRDKEVAEQRQKAAEETSREVIAQEKKTLSELKKLLKEGEDAQKEYADTAKSLRQELLDFESAQAAAANENLSALTQQRNLRRQIAENLRTVAALTVQGENAQAAALAKSTNELAQQVTSTRERNRLVRESANAYQYNARLQIQAAEEAERAQQEQNEATQRSIDEQIDLIIGLEGALEELTKDPKIIDIQVNIDDALDNIRELEQRLAELQAQAASVGRAGGGAIGFAGGGSPTTLTPGMIRGPGSSTSDSILARVSAGEHAFITKASRARKLWPLLNHLNFGSDAQVQRVLDSLPGGLRRAGRHAGGGFQTGGAVESGGMQPVNIYLPGGGRPAAQLFGEREQVEALGAALSRWSRGFAT